MLNELAERHGTDKGIACKTKLVPKRYTPIYSDLFLTHGKPQVLLEIGVAQGASMRMWEEFLPNTKIVGIDRNPVCRIHASDRIYIEIGDQSDRDFLSEVAQKHGPFGVIIDDGGHRDDLHMASFESLWEHCIQWYAIEDLHVSPGSVPWLREIGASFPLSTLAVISRKPVQEP